MFVCVCRAVSRSQLLAVMAAGADTLDEVERTCGAGGDCGTCRAEIADLLLPRPDKGAEPEAA